MGRRSALALAAALPGCAILSPDIARHPAIPPREIVVSLHTAPLIIDTRSYTVGGNFVADEPGRRGPPFLAQSAGFEFGDHDRVALALGRVPETPELRRILDDFAAVLERRGWRRVGRGEDWFALRFRRDAAAP